MAFKDIENPTSFWMEGSYKEENYPLLFVQMPHLNCEDIVNLLRLFDELYGNTDQDTAVWALEYQLLARNLVTNQMLLVNPKYLDISGKDTISLIMAATPKEDHLAWIQAYLFRLDQIRAAYQEAMGV